MELWHQILVSAGTVLTLLGGFLAISAKIKKNADDAMDDLEEKFEAKLSAQRTQAKLEKTKEAAEERGIYEKQCRAIEDMRKAQDAFQKKHIRQAEMQFSCHFTTLEALDKIAHKIPINGDIKDQLENLKEFAIRETTN